MARRLPAGFREDPDSKELRCPHRELSTCPQCAAEHPERIVESYGVHYWMNVAERAEWRQTHEGPPAQRHLALPSRPQHGNR